MKSQFNPLTSLVTTALAPMPKLANPLKQYPTKQRKAMFSQLKQSKTRKVDPMKNNGNTFVVYPK